VYCSERTEVKQLMQHAIIQDSQDILSAIRGAGLHADSQPAGAEESPSWYFNLQEE
jgi:hypothetical protein